MFYFGERTLSCEDKANKDKWELKPATALSDVAINAPFSRTNRRAHGNTLLQAHVSVAHAPSAADSRALSPITTERGSAACWEQTIWGICQVLVDSKQSTVKNTLPWLGSLLPAWLPSACSRQRKPPSPRWNLSSSVLFCSVLLLPTPAHCCTRLSGLRRFACEAWEGAATPRRPSPFVLPAVGEAAQPGKEGRRR